MKIVLPLLATLLAACPTNTISGQGATASAGAATGTGGAVGGQTSGGQATASTGSTGGTATVGSGGTSGSSGDAGACASFGTVCRANADCCSGACNGTCGQPFGKDCDADDDCSSASCVNDVCACSPDGGCAVDHDCCSPWQVCEQDSFTALEQGHCCSPVGGACVVFADDSTDCCADPLSMFSCIANKCQCIAPGNGGCLADSDCCEGKCKATPSNGVGAAGCRSGAGGACSAAYDCLSESCVDGGCNTCSEPNGSCSDNNDCCSGLVCANFPPTYRSHTPIFIGYGLNCCTPNGLSCDAGIDCCSEVCGSDGSCTCVPTSGRCYSDHGCCGGAACMLEPMDGGLLACCQMDGEGCFADGDCCSGTCQNMQCGCVATGGACGLAGQVAPEGAQACCSGQCSDAGTCL